jgi:YVTN family beta-propeller protein
MSLDARAHRAAQAVRNNADRLRPPPALGVLVARRRRRAAAVNVLAVALIVAVGGVTWWRFLPTGSPQPTATGLPRHVQAAIRVGEAPGAVAVEGSSVWVANSGDSTVSRIDPATNKVIATIKVGGRPTHLTAQSGALWVTTPDSMQWINPATNQVVQTLPLPAGPGDAAVVFDGCLAVSLNDGTVRVLTPFDGRELGSVSVASRGVSALANDRGKLWAANGDTLVAIHDLELKMTTRFTLQRDTNRNPQIADLVLVEGHLWAADADGDVTRYRVDSPERTLRGQLIAREGPSAIAAGPTGVFVASHSPQTVTRFDPSTGQAKARIHLPDVSDLAVGPDAVWATDRSRNLLYRIDPKATN